MIVVGRYISPVTPEDAYAATFVRVKPYCPGYRTHEIANHINFVRSDVEKHHHFDMGTVGEWFYISCRVYVYEGKGNKDGMERAGLCLTYELGICPILPTKVWRDLRRVSPLDYLDFCTVADGRYLKGRNKYL